MFKSPLGLILADQSINTKSRLPNLIQTWLGKKKSLGCHVTRLFIPHETVEPLYESLRLVVPDCLFLYAVCFIGHNIRQRDGKKGTKSQNTIAYLISV